MPWLSLSRVARAASLSWRELARTLASRLIPFAGLQQQRRTHALPWLRIPRRERSWRIPWGKAALVPWHVVPPIVPPEPEPEPPVAPPGNFVGLNLGCPVIGEPGFVPLNLGVSACYAVHPRRRTYIVLNSIEVVRLPDLTPIEVESVGIAGDGNAWGWSLEMSLANVDQLALLTPTVSGRREVRVTVNSAVWTFVIEDFTRQRVHPTRSVSVTGRSRSALLAAPYAPARSKVTTEPRTVAQLVDEELASTGFTAVYDTVDWEVPAGAWFYDGLTPMEAITRLAEASGAVVQSDPVEKILYVRARYPVSPWDWTTNEPDATIVDDVVLADALRNTSAPEYDAVVVTGELAGAGVTARVKLPGSAGTLYAPQASSPLINTADAARERGRNILSDRGDQASIDLTLPLFPAPLLPGQTGRVLPLQLVEVQEAGGTWHGLATALRLDVRRDDAAITVEQTVTLERHYTDAD